MSKSFQKKAKNVTVLGSETQFTGIIQFKDELIITGKFDGTIEATGYLEVDKKAICSVDNATAQSIVISGHVTGNLIAQERIEMKNGSKITGNVTTAKLRIEDNVDFQGKVTMLDALSENNVFSMPSNDYKESLILYKND